MKHQSKHDKSIFIASGIGIGLSIAVSAGLLFVLTALVNASKMRIDLAVVGTIVAQGLSVLVGTIIAGRVADSQKAIACGICAGGYIIFLIVLSMLFMNGVGGDIFVGLVVAGIGCIGGIILNKGKSQRNRSTKKRRFR